MITRAKFSRLFSVASLAFTILVLVSGSVSAHAKCEKVKGRYQEHAVAPTCGSAVGLCIEGEFSGDIDGMFSSTATAFQPNADTATTSVVWFTGDGVIHAEFDGKEGDILFKSSGSYQTNPAGDGNIVDLQTITGGTGQLTGISGSIRASGLFNPATGMGESEYEGRVCLP